jgi:hypothetical protein
MRHLFVLASICTLFALPAAAQEFRAINHMTVTPTGPQSFRVGGQAELWARDYWCAAGEYAIRRLRLPGNTRLYVVDPYVRGVRTVGFATDPGNLTPQTALVLGNTLYNPGANLSVNHAYGYCADFRLRRSN